jgi:hypothetical protein
VKNHDFTPKKSYFSNFRGAREIFGVFHVKNHDFTPNKIIFLPILGGGARRVPGAPPLNPPLQTPTKNRRLKHNQVGILCVTFCKKLKLFGRLYF